MNGFLRHLILVLALGAFVLLHAGCSPSNGGTTTGNPLVDDTSSSGAVAGALGGALSGSASGGASQLKVSANLSAMAGLCPTFASAQGADCNASGGSMWLTYNACHFPGSAATFTGYQAFFMTNGTATCGSFPNPGANQTLYRQYVTGSSSATPWSLLRENAAGINFAIDNHTTNLTNFDGVSLTTIHNGGYGVAVHFGANGARDSITFGHRINTIGSFDQTVYGSISITETGMSAASRTVSGIVDVYHNGLQVIGRSTINVVHNHTCCLPISGTISTDFRRGTADPTTLGARYVGKTETLTFTGCGTGTLTNFDGSVTDVTLNRCF